MINEIVKFTCGRQTQRELDNVQKRIVTAIRISTIWVAPEQIDALRLPFDVRCDPYLDSLFFFMYLVAQLPQGRFPSHFVLRALQRSQLAHNAMAESFLSSPFSSIIILANFDRGH